MRNDLFLTACYSQLDIHFPANHSETVLEHQANAREEQRLSRISCIWRYCATLLTSDRVSSTWECFPWFRTPYYG
jgi:hypothetical protein